MKTRLGVIVEKDGVICLQTYDNVWFPLNGNSGVAADFRESFNTPQQSDLGKRLYNVGGVLQMENNAQKAEREAQEAETETDCGQCEGTGTTDAMGYEEECPVCDGSGRIEKEDE